MPKKEYNEKTIAGGKQKRFMSWQFTEEEDMEIRRLYLNEHLGSRMIAQIVCPQLPNSAMMKRIKDLGLEEEYDKMFFTEDVIDYIRKNYQMLENVSKISIHCGVSKTHMLAKAKELGLSRSKPHPLSEELKIPENEQSKSFAYYEVFDTSNENDEYYGSIKIYLERRIKRNSPKNVISQKIHDAAILKTKQMFPQIHKIDWRLEFVDYFRPEGIMRVTVYICKHQSKPFMISRLKDED